ncbi:hypothetical protein CK203_068053 [Vitis vinifera]|uniref:Glycoside hydrolase 35 catalytic domain-containing protein n=1 Tax=Vitis vinifera TaxID=29760 RepID=A0A438EWH8_VITVI|nr:hypothetical protein CK203_068053 [Vitis vinifera]
MFQVDRWWGNLLPQIAPLLYDKGGPIIMVQVHHFCLLLCIYFM